MSTATDDEEDILLNEVYSNFEDDMRALAQDRLKLLDVLGVTEHEWACMGGSRFTDFETPIETMERRKREREERRTKFSVVEAADETEEPKGRANRLPSNFQEVVASLAAASIAAPPSPGPVALAPPLPPGVPPLPDGVPPLPTGASIVVPPLPLGVPVKAEPASAEIVVPAEWEVSFPSRPRIAWTDEQHLALDAIQAWRFSQDDFFSLTGPAGVGKSTLVREIVARYPEAALTAMTGKAALRLAECAGREASTLHKILYYPPKSGEDVRFTRLREPPCGLVAIDESSMCTPTVFADLKKWAYQGVRMLLVGDSFQLPPVITGKELQEHGEDFSVFSQVRGVELKTVMRNAGGVLRAATHVREHGEICRESGDGYEFAREASPIERAVDEYCNDRDDHFLITWRNSVRMRANKMIRERFGHDGPLPDAGEPVLVKKNGQGFLNGEIVVCGGFEDDGPMIDNLQCLWMRTAGGARILCSVDGGDREKGGEFFDGGLPWVKNWSKYHTQLKALALPEPLPLTFGYCLTCHAGQGGQARRTTVFLERSEERSSNFRKLTTLPSGAKASYAARWIYTATTRSREQSMLIVGK